MTEILNMTEIGKMTYDQFVIYAHKTVAVPELIFLFSGVFIILFLLGMIMIKGGQSKMKFLGVWILTLVMGFILLGFFLMFPTTAQSVINFFINLVK